MRKLIVTAAALAMLAGFASVAWAKCQKGQYYDCDPPVNGKQYCRCR